MYTDLSPPQLVALAFGVVYTLIGLIGFAATGFDGWISPIYTEKLLIFPINPAHNIIHVGLGLVWMVSATTIPGSKKVHLILGGVLLVVAALGFAGLLNFLAIEDASSPDNYLHAVTGAVALFFSTR